MNTATQKKNYSFRFSVELMDRLRSLARHENRSVNNYLETMIIDAVSHAPNDETMAAIEEARSGKARLNTPLDLSSVETMERSMGL